MPVLLSSMIVVLKNVLDCVLDFFFKIFFAISFKPIKGESVFILRSKHDEIPLIFK